MNENLDKLTDAIIGKVSEVLKGAISKILNSVASNGEDAVGALADLLGIGEEDIEGIMGDDIALLDFATIARICAALGISIEVNELKNGDVKEENHQVRREERRHRPYFGMVPPFPPPYPPMPHCEGRGFYDVAPKPTPQQEPRANVPNFRAMPRERLVKIIIDHLWDSEIDVNTATFESLVKFLEMKDAKMRAVRHPHRTESPMSEEPRHQFGDRERYHTRTPFMEDQQEAKRAAARERLKEQLSRKGKELFEGFFCN